MSIYPTPWTVEVLPRESDGEDPYGDTVYVYGDPVSERVYGWAPPGMSTMSDGTVFDASRDGIVRDLDIYVPPGFECGPRDRVVVDGLTYDVVSHVQDFTHGPFGFAPGGVLPLKRVEEAG